MRIIHFPIWFILLTKCNCLKYDKNVWTNMNERMYAGEDIRKVTSQWVQIDGTINYVGIPMYYITEYCDLNHSSSGAFL